MKVQLLKNGTDMSDYVFAETPEQEKAARERGYLFHGESKPIIQPVIPAPNVSAKPKAKMK